MENDTRLTKIWSSCLRIGKKVLVGVRFMKKTKEYCFVKKGTLYFIKEGLHCVWRAILRVAKTWERWCAAAALLLTELIDSMISPADSVWHGGETIETVFVLRMSSSNPTHFWMPAIQNKISSNGDQTNYLRGMGNGAISGLDWISLGEQQDSNLQFDFTEFFRFLLCVKQNQPARCACCSRRQGLTYRVGFSQMEISWLILPRGRGDSTIAPLWSPSLVTSATSPLGPPPTARSIFTRTGWEKWGRWGVTSSSQLSEQWGRRWSSWVQSATLRPSGPLVSLIFKTAFLSGATV